MVAAYLNITDDHIETQVRIGILIEARFKIRRRRGIGKIHSAPFDIEDPVRRTACDRREDTAGSAGETSAARLCIGLQVLPHREDGIIIRPDVGRRGQTGCDVAARFVNRHEVEAPIGADIYAVKGLIVQLEREWQRHKCIAIVGVITDIGVTWHDRIRSVGYDVLARRTTLDVIIPREGRVTIASFSGD